MVKVIWTDSAIQDLDDIAEYISRDSVRYAEITAELSVEDLRGIHDYLQITLHIMPVSRLIGFTSDLT